MRACTECFKSAKWIANASPPEASAGTCEFGHNYNHRTWQTTVWVDSFLRLFAVYEIETDPNHGLPLHLQIQADWEIFTFDDPLLVRKFLLSVIEDEHELLAEGVNVRLRTTDEATSADHLSSWAEFSEEIRTRNRYFPQTVPDRYVLEEVLLQHAEPIQRDVPLYRARLIEPQYVISPKEMGAPPPEKAAAGRANPVGIPYLYLSFAKETCIYETRVANHTQVAIGTFRPTRDLSVLNLADIEPPDFFDVDDTDNAAENAARRVAFHRYLVALGNELRKPVRSTAQPTDYIPTQYLCELAKALRLDGVLYSSSLHPAGRNLVLFDVNAATCSPDIEVVEITTLHAVWKQVN